MDVIFSGHSGGSFIILIKNRLIASLLVFCLPTFYVYLSWIRNYILTIIRTTNIVKYNTRCKTEICEKRELVHRLRKKKIV